MKLSEEVQRHVQEAYVNPAQQRGETNIRIKAGDVHRALHWVNRVPSVCTTLSSKKLQRETGLELIAKEGPPSGFGTRAEFFYRLPSVGMSQSGSGAGKNRLEELYGRLSEVFRALGGGEAYLRQERAGLHFRQDDDPDKTRDNK